MDEAEVRMDSSSSVQFAQKAAIVDGTRILMVRKSSDDPHNPELWELPGGRMHFGEDIEQHLLREIREEVGLEVKLGRPLCIWSWIMQHEGAPRFKSWLLPVYVPSWADRFRAKTKTALTTLVLCSGMTSGTLTTYKLLTVNALPSN